MLNRNSPSTISGRSSRVVARPSSIARLTAGLLKRLGNPAVALILWNGESISTSLREPIGNLLIDDRMTLLRLCVDPEMEFGEAYSRGRIRVQGSLTRILEEVNRAAQAGPAQAWIGAALRRLRTVVRYSTRSRSRGNIHHHYDIGNGFYALWLGQTMAYTCAYYPSPETTLDVAQVAKMEHVCRKLRLKPGEHVLEAGCGWGTMALHMAREHGVRVTAFNISQEQLAYARRRARAEGLSDRVRFVEGDYRDIARSTDPCDAFVSIGMLEHVNLRDYEDLGLCVARCLGRSGRGLIHSIGRNRPSALSKWIERRIFPGAYAPAIGEMMRLFAAPDLSVLDVENLRPHYARTLQHWRFNFQRHLEEITGRFDVHFVRMWELYLCGSEAAFNTGNLQLFQILFAPRTSEFSPWTRADIYDRSQAHDHL